MYQAVGSAVGSLHVLQSPQKMNTRTKIQLFHQLAHRLAPHTIAHDSEEHIFRLAGQRFQQGWKALLPKIIADEQNAIAVRWQIQYRARLLLFKVIALPRRNGNAGRYHFHSCLRRRVDGLHDFLQSF